MTFIDVAARNAAAASITEIGLATSASTEIDPTGNAYVRLTPTWGGDGTLDLALEFDGPANTEVTHVILSNGTADVYRAVTPKSFNSDGKINLSSYDVSATLGA